MEKLVRLERGGWTLKNAFNTLSQRPSMGLLSKLAIEYSSQHSDLLRFFADSVVGLKTLKSKDHNKMREYTSDKGMTIIHNPELTIIKYLKGLNNNFEKEIVDLKEVRNLLRTAEEEFKFVEGFDAAVFSKYLISLEDALSGIIGAYHKLNRIIHEKDCDLADECIDFSSIDFCFNNMAKAFNSLMTFSFNLRPREDVRATMLDHFQVSPVNMDEIRALCSCVASNNVPDVKQMRCGLDKMLTQKIEGYYDECNAQTGATSEQVCFVISKLSDAGYALDSIPPAQFKQISDISSLIKMAKDGKIVAAEQKYREKLFMRQAGNVHDFVNDREEYQSWRKIRSILQMSNERDAKSALKALIKDVLVDKERQAFGRSSVMVRT